MHFKAVFALLPFLAWAAAQTVTNTPSFTGYTTVTQFNCTNRLSLERIIITTACGEIVSPCYPNNHTEEVTEGNKIWDFNVGSPVAGYRVTVHDFFTIGRDGILYIGNNIVINPGGTLGVQRDLQIFGKIPQGPGFTIENNTNDITLELLNNNVATLNAAVDRLFLSFYSTTQKTAKGFNITFCADIDQCRLSTPFCQNLGVCVRNGFESYSCNCPTGFTGSKCETDIDECTISPSKCDANAACTNSPSGSFTCTCNTGYTGTGRADGDGCSDINECTSGTNNCASTGGICTDTVGSFSCSCDTGYSGDGITCTDINECTSGTTNCATVGGRCTNIPGSFTCSCIAGYSGDGITCSEENECTSGTATCASPGGFCTNTVGSFTCSCITGYSGDGFTCTDDDECTLNTDDCHATLATCANTPGSFTCTCIAGYNGDGVTCTDIDECSSTPCDGNANCTNIAGSFSCFCNTGYTGNGLTCNDINECANDNTLCKNAENSTKCENIPGNYTCICNSPAFRGTSASTCQGYFCPGVDKATATCTQKGIIEWPTFYDGSMTYLIEEQVSWFVNLTGQTAKTAIRFTFLAVNTESQQDYIFFSSSPDYRVLESNPIIITGFSNQINGLLNGTNPVSANNPVGYDPATMSYTVSTTEIYVHFYSDRQNVFSGFQISYEPDVDDCSAINPCQNSGTCVDGVFDYSCMCSSGFTGKNCTDDLNECRNSSLINCNPNADCTNTIGSYTCTCKASFTGNGTFCQPLIMISNVQVVSTGQGSGAQLNITWDVTAMWKTDPNYVEKYSITLTNIATGVSTTYTSKLVNASDFQPMIVSADAFSDYTVSISIANQGPQFSNAVVVLDVSATSNTTSAETVPRQPTGLTPTANSDILISLQWTPPVETMRGVTLGYSVEIKRIDADCTLFARIGDTDQCNATIYELSSPADRTVPVTYTITDLIAYRTYTIRVRARTSAGYGAWSSSIRAFSGVICSPYVQGNPPTLCTDPSAALQSENFPNSYPSFQHLRWRIDHAQDIRLRVDYFQTEQDQDHLDFGYGSNPSTNSADRVFTWSGSVNASTTQLFANAISRGNLWALFDTDIFRDNAGFQVRYDIDVDRCSSDPCLNGGICSRIPYDFNCSCPSLWSGKVCNKQLVTVVATCTSSTTSRADVSWTVPTAYQNDNAVIQGYKVTFTRGSSTLPSTTYSIGSSSDSASGFGPYESYTATVEVLAVSPATVPTTDMCSGRTAQGVPDAPIDVSAVNDSSTSLQVSWTAPAVVRGVLSGYTITYLSTDHATYGETEQTGTVPVGATMAMMSSLVSGLRVYREYSVMLSATTGGGTGPQSTAVIARTSESAPTNPPRNLALTSTSRTITATYIAPITTTGAYRYIVSYYKTADGSSTSKSNTATDSLTDTISSLTPNTQYTIEVRAVAAGMMGPVVTGMMMTKEDRPGVVTGVGFRGNATVDSITVIWSPPSEPNGDIIAYTVEWSPSSGSGVMNVSGNITELTVTSLMAYTTYNFTVKAWTAVGDGPASTPSTQQTAEAVPGAVQNLVVTSNARSVSVAFDEPAIVTGMLSYYIEYSITGSGSPPSNMTFTTKSGTISSLLPFTSYTFVVFAQTSAGRSTMSVTETVTTKEDVPGVVGGVLTFATTPTSIVVSWVAPNMPNGIISGYRVNWTSPFGSGGSPHLENTTTTFTITNLIPYVTYSITIFARTSAGINTGYLRTQQTNESAPGAVMVAAVVNSDNTITVNLTPPSPPRGRIDFYRISVVHDATQCTMLGESNCYDVTSDQPASQTSFTTEVIPGGYRSVIITVWANNSIGFGQNTTQAVVTNSIEPAQVTNVVVTAATDTSAIVTFTTARPVPGPSNFTITATSTQENKTLQITENNMALNGSASITGLIPGLEYSITVIQITSVASGPRSNSVNAPGVASPISGATANVSVSQQNLAANALRTHAFAIGNPCNSLSTLFSTAAGPILSIDVIVKQQEAASNSTTMLFWSDAVAQPVVPPYHAANVDCTSQAGRRKRALSSNGETYTVGADMSCNASESVLCNGQLPSGRSYQVSYRANTGSALGPSAQTDYSQAIATEAAPTTTVASTTLATGLLPGEIAAIVICSIIVLLLIILLAYYCYKRRQSTDKYKPTSAPGIDNKIFDDVNKERYRVDPSVPAAVTYSDSPAPASEELS